MGITASPTGPMKTTELFIPSSVRVHATARNCPVIKKRRERTNFASPEEKEREGRDACLLVRTRETEQKTSSPKEGFLA